MNNKLNTKLDLQIKFKSADTGLVLQRRGGHVNDRYFFLTGHENDGGGLVRGEVPLEVVLRPEDPIGIDRGGGLRNGVSNHLFIVKIGVSDDTMMGQFS